MYNLGCKALGVLAVTAALLGDGGSAVASPIVGSLPLNGGDLSQNSTDLSKSTQISAVNAVVLTKGTQDFSVVPLMTDFGSITLDMANLGAFKLSSPTYGTFQASSGQIVQQSANFLDLYLLGTYTPGPGIPGTESNAASLRFSINQSGTSISEAITLTAPPAALSSVPEPASLAMLGIGAVSMAAYGVRRRKRAAG
jgi:hypothetical protein